MYFRRLNTYIICAALLLACSKKNTSQPITLYKDAIASGNSIVSFVNSYDENGTIAMGFCEEMRLLYEKKFSARYFCAPVSFADFTPRVDWTEK
jgi:hypothetical protein